MFSIERDEGKFRLHSVYFPEHISTTIQHLLLKALYVKFEPDPMGRIDEVRAELSAEGIQSIAAVSISETVAAELSAMAVGPDTWSVSVPGIELSLVSTDGRAVTRTISKLFTYRRAEDNSWYIDVGR